MNILSNAIQSIPAEGKIFIKTWQDQQNVKISIRDTGSWHDRRSKKKNI
jgi:Signal transduction histidine kinase regulating C4-dicarboxylate transport system